eukprot:TRINITY_DN12349_c0_g1_i2.p2 TRINITY_DN12349_c0_g1~~TRINITY_DN12349_c0_g1_i2.p2  ORF type:complete len:170 (+),score=35.45 TRINITY_DN12349_c0_g1_i2:112-621(+)
MSAAARQHIMQALARNKAVEKQTMWEAKRREDANDAVESRRPDAKRARRAPSRSRSRRGRDRRSPKRDRKSPRREATSKRRPSPEKVRGDAGPPKDDDANRNIFEQERLKNIAAKEDSMISRMAKSKGGAWLPEDFFGQTLGEKALEWDVKPSDIENDPAMLSRNWAQF